VADAQRTIELVFEGVDKTAAATQAALNNANKFAGNLQSATQPIADFTGSAVKLEAGILAAGAALVGFSVKAAGDFQSAAADLQKVLSETDSIERYTDLAIEMSERYGVASVDVLNSITNYKQAGFTAREAGDLTKAGLDLVIAGNVEAAESSAQLVASIKGFGAEVGDSAIIVDLLNQVSNEYAATTGQLLKGFSTLSPVAKTAGLSLQETIGILTPGIEVFQSGSEVANALRTAFLSLVDDNPTVVAALEELGVSQTGVNGELRSARDIYFDVATALQGVEKEQQIYLASQLVGKQRTSQFLAVTAGLSDTLRIASDSYDFLGSAAKEVALQLGTAEKAADRAKAAFTNLFIVIGEPLLDEFGGVADAITAIFQSLGASAKKENSGINQLVSFIEGEFRGLQETLETVARNLPAALDAADFSDFIAGVRTVSNSLGVLFDEIDLTTVDGLKDAIELAGAAFLGLSEFTAGVIESFGPMFDAITDIVGGLRDLDPELAKSLGNFSGFATQANILSGALVSLLPSIEALVAIIAGKQSLSLVTSLGSAGASLQGKTGLIAQLGKGGLLTAAGAAGLALGTLANKAAELTTGTSISTFIGDVVEKFNIFDDSAYDIINSLNDGMTPALNQMGDAARTSADSLKEIELTPQAAAGTIGILKSYDDILDDTAEATSNLGKEGKLLEGTFSVVSNSMDKAAASTDKLGSAGNKLQLEKQLAAIKAQSVITAAQISADAERAVAAYESISTAIESTGSSVTDLFSLLGDDDISKFDKLDIVDQIEKEDQRRQESFEQQKRLTDAEIVLARARAKALTEGSPLIKVNGDGLKPHLEAIMYELFQAIQTRVNKDGLQTLLGTS